MFNSLTLLPSDPIYGMQALYKADERPSKINLSIGICLNEQGKLLRFKALEEAESRVFKKSPSKEYLPITGLASFCEKAQKLIVGDRPQDDFFSAQTVGGTGALFVAGQLLVKAGIKQVFIPEPSWPNHKQLFEAAGLTVTSYPYYDKANICLEFDKMVEAVANMPVDSAIVLQASCHNPTGIDPTANQWQILSTHILQKQILPIFDLAYLGLGDGIQEDAQGIQTFLNDGHDMFICTTFAKSMGLYNDRLGLLSIKMPKTQLDILASHVRSIARTCYSSPPAAGAHLAAEILSDSTLAQMWKDELNHTRLRLQTQRSMLFKEMQNHSCKIPFEHLLQTKGLFCLLDVPPEKVITLRENDGIYIALDGRISLAAITNENAAVIAKGLSKL